ncbi:hypothetical protein C8D92_10244 [Tamilnaduibacter salinus]|uniref:TIGR01777 family protein n=1 Tax=Tamilnaduibacter salinus TaxID=1484056 RepID=A0A2A2I4E0_9GAMM|nr:TIGR01777 family oxidoreductase [Tamilnaduibacter salinus]PAV26268.1 TIGR01777 family protein [Tamilnaduibacter salinus]PVY78011.1 hypothetical protein C8D92_10244 [Tamilnaduibacter salinus]
MTSHLLVTGGTGFIGQRLCPRLLKAGYDLTVFSRQGDADVRSRCGRVRPLHQLKDVVDLPDIEGVINLAGEGIADGRWTPKRKQALRDSRIAFTHELMDYLSRRDQKPPVVVSGSAVGFYGNQGGQPVTEETAPKDEFTHELCRDWEAAAERAVDWGARVCLSRTGVVAGPQGGFLKRMLLPFRLGLGGRLGNGQQYLPWVHRDDVVSALIWMLETPDASGPYNVVSPQPATNQHFTRTLGTVLHRPTVFPVPAAVLRMGLGEMSTLLLEGQRAHPERLEAAGFRFEFPQLEKALQDAVR